SLPAPEEIFGGKKIPAAADMPQEQAALYAGESAYAALACRKPLEEALREQGMLQLFRDIEMPLVLTLRDMEREGMRVLPEALHAYGENLTDGIDTLEKQIYEEAGEEFNINSPRQLGAVLFEKKGLPGGKKTKTGYSTSADILEPLAAQFPLVQHVLDYRQLTKLRSTYAEGLAGEIADDGKIHTTFHQTITATGRISSTDPNLQNIPVRVELGRQLRKIFVPADGYVYIDADYSQIELRVLASLSGDQKLISAYRDAEDIHRITASQVFHVPFDEVTPLQRRRAKAVNFGIVYGISSYGLSQDLGISRKEAEEYIQSYYETYPGIRGYLEGLVASARSKGYTETYFGRRRPMPELKSSNFMTRQFGERVAKNAPIQGTAADIIKIAMNRVSCRLRKEGLKARLILQVHDELLVEAPVDEEEAVKRILTEEMTGAADLAVKMEVSLGCGANWYEAH
ncbi:MAG: DNA polymerase I, partial [Lachnospiraceae bacterium]|nr:DNA polymerase I [Lachnospiraceae bacterium]